MITKAIRITLIVFTLLTLMSCVVILRNQRYEVQNSEKLPADIKWKKTHVQNAIALTGLILPVFPAWMSVDKLLTTNIGIGSDSASCPVILAKDYSFFSYPQRKDNNQYTCFYQIAIDDKTSENVKLLWKGRYIDVDLKRTSDWHLHFSLTNYDEYE